jgi:hypothetical protein
MKKKEVTKKRNIGDLINAQSKKPIPFVLTMGDEVFNLVLKPAAPPEALAAYADLITSEDPLKRKEALKPLISACFFTEDGNKVWDDPKAITVEGAAWVRLQSAIYAHVLCVNISEYASKN